MRLAALVIAIGGVLSLVAAKNPQPTGVPKWEYRTVWDQTDTAKLNALGRDGWELVSVHTASLNGTTGREVGWLFFKRPISE